MKFESFKWRLGNGKTILFWEGWWCGAKPLRCSFPRLYRLSLTKGRTESESVNGNMLSITEWKISFSRPHFDRESVFAEEVIKKVGSFNLSQFKEDVICWVHDKIKAALETFKKARWASRTALTIEFVNRSLINRLENSLERPWNSTKYFAEIDSLIRACVSVQFKLVDSPNLSMASSLAFDGLSRLNWLVAWW
ncbi:hypothetical protein V6N13_116596 [Hibiscus sabdariffa]